MLLAPSLALVILAYMCTAQSTLTHKHKRERERRRWEMRESRTYFVCVSLLLVFCNGFNLLVSFWSHKKCVCVCVNIYIDLLFVGLLCFITADVSHREEHWQACSLFRWFFLPWQLLVVVVVANLAKLHFAFLFFWRCALRFTLHCCYGFFDV